MLNISQRLATLDPKAKAATRTAKDGEEYSQLILEVAEIDLEENEINALSNSPNAYSALKAMFAACPSITSVDIGEKLESASVVIRTAAVSAANGPEFTFNDCRVDKMSVNREMKGGFRITAKPALDSKFGQLIERLSHTVMIQVSGPSASDQSKLPLNSAGAGERGTSSIGSAYEEREKARIRDRQIEQDNDTVHRDDVKAKGADEIKKAGKIASRIGNNVKREKVDTSKRKKQSNRAAAH